MTKSKNNPNYLEVKNYIHNELGINKEYIQAIIRETVVTEINKAMTNGEFLNSIIQNQVVHCLNKQYTKPEYRKLFNLNTLIYDKVCQEISETVSKNIQIKVGLNKDNLEIYEFEEAKLFKDK